MTLNRSLLASVVALLLGVGVVNVVTSGTLLSLFTQAIVYAVFALGIGVVSSVLCCLLWCGVS